MKPQDRSLQDYLPEIGCALLLASLLAMCMLPYLVVDAMATSLAKLHLWPPLAMLIMLAIITGGFVNVPVRYIERDRDQPMEARGWLWWVHQLPLTRRAPNETVIAVNVGGCVIPCVLAVYQIVIVSWAGRYPLAALAIATLANIGVCYYVARPMPGIGIGLPGFVAPAVAVGLSWLLLGRPEFSAVRAPVAFVAGIAGPLVGADLLHLRDFSRVSAGMLSIGGAGTLDGIVLSGLLAALLT